MKPLAIAISLALLAVTEAYAADEPKTTPQPDPNRIVSMSMKFSTAARMITEANAYENEHRQDSVNEFNELGRQLDAQQGQTQIAQPAQPKK